MIKLTKKGLSLGVVQALPSEIQKGKIPGAHFLSCLFKDCYLVYRTDEARREMSEKWGRYTFHADYKIPERNREVAVLIGFDEYGNHQISCVNYGRGYFPKKVKEFLIKDLCDWLVLDGWAEYKVEVPFT